MINYNSLALAALAYLTAATKEKSIGEEEWPFSCEFVTGDYLHNLKKCMEYLQLEIDRISKN